MSKSKKVSNSVEEYSELKNQLLTNVKSTVEAVSELNNLVQSVFNDESSETELVSIKQEWIDSSNKIDKIDETIISLTKEKLQIIKKMETLISKKGKSTPAQAKALVTLKEEWLEISNQITVLNNQLESYNKERAKLINKTETYFSKLDSKDKKVNKKEAAKPVKAIVKKGATEAKETPKKPVAKEVKKPVAKETKKTVAKGKKKEVVEEKEEEASEEEAGTNQVKLKLDSDSDTESSESDTDSNLSSIESDSDDSDSDSSDDDGDDQEV